MSLVVHSHAKINLYLDVLERREDGFTNIETIFQSVALHDTLEGRRRDGEIALTCSDPSLPVDAENLVHRAAQRLRTAAGTAQGARLHLHKRIPVAAGMAGGSGNAAAALCLLNRLWALDWPQERLLALAAELGSDVPFCMLGGTMQATGRGECLETVTRPSSCWVVLVHPPLQISAGALYAHPQLTRNTSPRESGKTAAFRRALQALEQADWEALVFNRMESAAFTMYPELAQIKAELLEAGCMAAAMSGSGPTLFGLCHDEDMARAVAVKLSDKHRCSVTRFVARGLVEAMTPASASEVQA